MNSNEKHETSVYLQALEADQLGNWELAHSLVQDLKTNEAALIHAYLHRKEGDNFNAEYWYHRAGKSLFKGSLLEEFEWLKNNISRI